MSADGQKIIAEVRSVAALNPGKVYQGKSPGVCSYMHGDSPGCIIGNALFNLGYLPSKGYVEGKSASVVVKMLGLEVDDVEGYWLDAVQAAQDGRVGDFVNSSSGRATWSQAVLFADTHPYTPATFG